MNGSSARGIAQAIQHARERIPDLRVVIKPDCGDAAWLVDHCCGTVYLSALLPVQQVLPALEEALVVLVAEDECRRGATTRHVPLQRAVRHEPRLVQHG